MGNRGGKPVVGSILSSEPIVLSPRDGYDLWARSWDGDPSPIVALESRTTAPRLGDLRGKRFIEASCGTGRWLAHAAEGGAQARGFDLSPAMLAEAAAKPGLRGRVALADSRALPAGNGCADIVLCALSLGHMPPAETTVSELARVVAPAGTLIVTDFHPEASRAGWKRTFRRGAEVCEVENHPYSIAAVCRVAAQTGLLLRELAEPCFGEPERDVFLRAGRADLFEAACARPAIFAVLFQRPG